MRSTTIDVIGIQSLEHSCLWFSARCGSDASALKRRKKWGKHRSVGYREGLWTYSCVYDATRFKDLELARLVCDRLNAEMPQAEWEVVQYEEVKLWTRKVLYAPKKGRR